MRAGIDVEMATDVGQAVGDNQPGGAKNDVVAPDLFEDFLGQTDMRSLVLNNHQRRAVAAEHDAVATAGSVIQAQRHLVAKQSGRVALVMHKKVDEMLAHPFLRRQAHIASAQDIEHLSATVSVTTDAQLCRG